MRCKKNHCEFLSFKWGFCERHWMSSELSNSSTRDRRIASGLCRDCKEKSTRNNLCDKHREGARLASAKYKLKNRKKINRKQREQFHERKRLDRSINKILMEP